MTTYSDAAKAYGATSSLHHCAVEASRFGESCPQCVIAAAAFDAGAAYDAPPLKAWERELLGAAPEPVRLTADDPRWRDGAKVRGEFADGSAVEGFVNGNFVNVSRDISGCAWPHRQFTAVYLIAEAPDPDADVLFALSTTMPGEYKPAPEYVLNTLRAAGYDVVRADS